MASSSFYSPKINNDKQIINEHTGNYGCENLNIACFNVSRLVLRFNQVRFEVESHNYDIVAITETFLNDQVTDDLIRLQGYDLIRSDRLARMGGGVAIYIKSEISARVLISSSSYPESLCDFLIIELKMNGENLLFSVIYRPPRVKHPKYFFNEISSFLPKYKHFVLTGDLNANMISSNTYSKPIYDFIECNALYLVPSEPTCHKNGDSWLDLFIVSNVNSVLKYCKSECPLYEHHDTIELTFKILKPVTNKNVIQLRDFSNFNECAFKFELQQKLSAAVYDGSVNSFCSLIHKLVKDVLDLHAPVKKIFYQLGANHGCL